MVASRFAFPGWYRVACEAAPSLTVAGPRRIRTGFPVRPVVGAQNRQGITMCYKPPLPRVSASDITGKTGERPARFRHCDEGSLLRVTT
jgi:hypothetical protein